MAERFGVLLGIGVENDENLFVTQLYCQHYNKNVKISSVVNLELQVPLRGTSNPRPPPRPPPGKPFPLPIELNSRMIFYMIICTS